MAKSSAPKLKDFHHGLKQLVGHWYQLFRTNLRLTARPRIDPIVALKYYIEGGKLVVKSVRHSEMYHE